MDKKSPQNYQLEDFVSDESFFNYHFKLNKENELFWDEWLLNNPHKEPLVKEAKEIINDLSLQISGEEYSQELQKLEAAINKQEEKDTSSRLSATNKLLYSYNKKRRKIGRILVPVILLIIAIGYFIFRPTQNDFESLTDIVNNESFPLVLTLGDSTIVTLSPHSHLRYPLQFKAKERNVYLYGNARFSVKRDMAHPFKVHAENIVATVLGTVFNIKSSDDSAIVVQLLKGKLNVEIMNSSQQAEQSVLLNPNEEAVYVRNEKHLYKSTIATEHYLNFRKSNFDEISSEIKKAFGITLINKSAKKDWSFTGEFEKNTTAKEIVENICLVKNLSFVVKGDTIVIK